MKARKRSARRARDLSPLERAQQAGLRLIEEARLHPAPPRHANLAGPPTLTLGPVVLGTAAQLAAALLELRHAQEIGRAAEDRALVEPDPRDAVATAREAGERVARAREKVRVLKDAIHRGRLVSGLGPADPALGERALRRLGLSDDVRLVPFGVRPAPGTRVRPAAVPTPPSAPSFAEMVVEKILGRPVPNREEAK